MNTNVLTSMISLSIDDGCASDVRVASLALKYNIPTTFYWPVEWRSLALDKGYEPLTYEQAIMIARTFEIGSHTVTHRHLTNLTVIEAMVEIAESQQILREMFDQPIEKFCPPRGYTNLALTQFTLGLYGSQRLTKGKGLVHIHPKSGANNNVNWRDYYDSIKHEVENIEFWGHSWEWDKYNMWNEIEEFFHVIHRQLV